MHYLLVDVCVRLGFCGGDSRVDVQEMIAKSPVDKVLFSSIILEAEGCTQFHACRPEIENMFSEVFHSAFSPRLTDGERLELGLT